MNDRFKFRVWDKKEKRYINFEQFKKGDIEFNFNPQTNEIWIEYDKSRYVVEQCTGLKDKNGTLIYEGDIVKRSGQAFIVEWRQDRLSFILSNYENLFESYDITHFEIEVIGNIHENPELLEKK